MALRGVCGPLTKSMPYAIADAAAMAPASSTVPEAETSFLHAYAVYYLMNKPSTELHLALQIRHAQYARIQQIACTHL